MMQLFLVYRKFGGTDESLTAAFLTKSLADNFASEMENMSRGTGCESIRVAEIHISTYGMETGLARETIDAFNSIVARL